MIDRYGDRCVEAILVDEVGELLGEIALADKPARQSQLRGDGNDYDHRGQHRQRRDHKQATCQVNIAEFHRGYMRVTRSQLRGST